MPRLPVFEKITERGEHLGYRGRNNNSKKAPELRLSPPKRKILSIRNQAKAKGTTLETIAEELGLFSRHKGGKTRRRRYTRRS